MKKTILSLSVMLMSLSAVSQTDGTVTVTETTVETIVSDHDDSAPATATGTPAFSHFTWGADIGSSIDMTGQELTAFDISACFGYKGSFVRFAGAGAGIKMMVSNSSRAYPVFAMLRSGFSSKPTLCFMEIKAGVSFVNLHDSINQTSLYTSAGIGFTLAKGRNFSSHMVLAYEFTPLKDHESMKLDDMHYATIRIGASF